MIKGEAGDMSGNTAQRSPRNVDSKLAEKIEQTSGLPERTVSQAVGKVINFGGTNQNSIQKVKVKYKMQFLTIQLLQINKNYQ